MNSVIFDLDGTLADTSADLIAAANACFADMGAPGLLDPEADAATAFHGGRAMLRLGLSRMGRPASPETEAEVDRWYAPLLDAYEQAIDTHTTLYPGALDAVASLKARGIATGICTNKPERLARLLLARLGVADTFAALVGADTLPVRKPDPEPLFEAVRRATDHAGSTAPARTILIGDTITDRDTARAAGVPIVLVTFGPNGPAVADLAPDALLHSYDALPALAADLLA